MQNFRCVSAIAAVAVFAAGAAAAQTSGFRSEARLKSAAGAPREETISGVAWRCDGDECQGAADRKGNLDGLVRECKKVVAVVGPVASYRSGGRELSDGQVRACNKAAIQVQAARN
ncbi:hypothetical protein [Phenylobacterium sp.]|uniref:CC_3452 family protein n=1 Tax=Phenylobacterium sp. TaxID=1871053 RepID=UPI0025F810FC|nr:hypothetical protein [Phenylobacterium sp.]